MLQSTQKRSSGEPYLSPTSARKHHPTFMSRRSSSSLPKITSSSGSSTMGMILPLPPLKFPSSKKSSNRKKDDTLSQSSCHVEIIHENEEDYYDHSDNNLTTTNTEKYMRSSRSKSCTDANNSSTAAFNDARRVEDLNRNVIEDYDEALSQEIALAVALIVAEYEMMKKNKHHHHPHPPHHHHGKKSSSSHSHSHSSNSLKANDSDIVGGGGGASGSVVESKERMILGENTVIPSPSTVSSATSQLQFDPPDLVPVTPQPVVAPKVQSHIVTARSSTPRAVSTPAGGVKYKTISGMWKTPPSPSRGARTGGSNVEVHRYLTRVQHFMNSLGYHREGEPEIKINVRLSMKMQMITAKEMIRAAMPIKCLHAVVLATFLTNCIDTVERFPIYFRSHVGGKEYKHIVLGIYVQGHYGALGISRDQGLQDKTITYTKLSDLIFEFAKCYEQSGHILNEIKFGQVITHDQNSVERLFSKIGLVPISGCAHAEIESNVERFARLLRTKMSIASLRSTHPAQQQSSTLGRLSRSRTSIHGGSGNSMASPQSSTHSQSSSQQARARAMSIGAIARRSSEERLGRVQTVRSKPPKSIRK